MKKIYYLLYLATAVLFTACTNEEDDLFDTSSALRADAAIAADTKILTDAANGWVMEYFPEAQQSYGGYNVLLKFGTDGKVTVASELYDNSDITTSLYSVKQSAGIVLSFDTYNEIFHFFSDPSDPAGVGGNGYGLEGDYDFLILEATAEKVTLKGKKTGGIAILTPMKEDWEEYILALQNAEEEMSYQKLQLEMNGKVIPVSISFRTLTFTYAEGENSVSVTASYIQTPTGYKFYEPVEVDGVTLSGFTFNAEAEFFTANDNSNIKLIPVIPPLNEQFVTGNWFFAYSEISAALQPYFAMAANGSASEGEQILYMYMGLSGAGSYSFSFNSGGYTGSLLYNYTLTGEDEITLTFALQGEGDGVYYYNNCNYNYVIAAIGNSAGASYKLTTDDLKAPSFITLTSTTNPARYFTLYPNLIAYPFTK